MRKVRDGLGFLVEVTALSASDPAVSTTVVSCLINYSFYGERQEVYQSGRRFEVGIQADKSRFVSFALH